jgi:hypothetical protein
MASEWTPELKEQVIAEYLNRNPTPENTTDILLELAEEFEKTPNGVRRILIADGSYVSKAATNTATATKTAGKDAPKKASKADSISELVELLNFNGIEVDMGILDKLTGKAAVYFTGAFKEALRQSK